MDKLKAFESFVSVATRGSLTAAAKAEGVAPAIMGRRLDALEEHLGVKLLVRTTRRISLTHEGSAFLEDCQRLLSDVANAEASVSEGGVKATGHLRITAPAGFGRRHVAPLVPRFRSAHPDVTISLNLSDRVVDLAGAGFDCAVRAGDPLDCSDGQVLHDWWLGGWGIAWRSTCEVEAEIAAGRLVAVLEDFAAPPNGIYVVFPQRKHLPLRVRLWIEHLKHQYAQPAFWKGPQGG